MNELIIRAAGLFVLSVMLLGCAKEPDCDPTGEGSPCGLAGGGDILLLVETKTNGKTSSLNEYDSQNRTAVIRTFDPDGKPALVTSYSYKQGAFPSTVRAENKDGSVVVKEYVYGEQGKPSSAVATPLDGGVPLDYTYSYERGKLTETITPRKVGEMILVNQYSYDDNGNLLSMESYADGAWQSTVEQGDFDGYHASYTHSNPEGWMFPGLNNPERIKASSLLLGLVVDAQYKYTYNKSGYPVKVEVFDKLSGGALVETIEYYYRAAP